MENIIEIKDVNFRYHNSDEEDLGVNVLEHINLNIKKGEFVAILGHNGSGKSTLAKLCNAILTPSSGVVLSYGFDTSDEQNLFDIRKKIGMVFQNPDNQLVATVVEEDVAFGLENIGVPTDEMRKRVDEALRAVDMYEYREHAPHKLSGGQKQRVAIAGIIAMKPECIVLDEPTAMLDPRGRNEVMNTIRMLNRDYGITIVLITHYMEEAAEADRIIVIDGGAVMLDGKPEDVFSQVALLKSVGLDVPQVTDLMYCLKEQGFPADTHIISEEAAFDLLYRLLL
ncbi:MAG: energy-coupling factor transporter ATPase [Ruminococcus sp.]|jgi:energy-coupling factor transport system ATP-binding protein|nr:energy-coupling factor transporter ATPase [Ruminococcus sp.]